MSREPNGVAQAKQTKKKPVKVVTDTAICSNGGPASFSKEGEGSSRSRKSTPPKFLNVAQLDLTDPLLRAGSRHVYQPIARHSKFTLRQLGDVETEECAR
jgi:hypothetical protein